MRNFFIKVANATSNMWIEKTKKTNNRSSALNWLPGLEKELKAIGGEEQVCKNIQGMNVGETTFVLKMNVEDIRARFWSVETRCFLLKERIWVLLDDFATVEEFEILLTMNNIPLDVWLKVLRRYTPSSSHLKTMVNRVEEHILEGIIEEMPQAFNDLKVWQFLNLPNEKTLPNFDDLELQKRFRLFYKLVTKRPKIWVLPAIELIKSVPPQRLNEFACSRLNSLVFLATRDMMDVSDYIAYLYVFHPSTYVNVRNYCLDGCSAKTSTEVIVTLLPQIIGKLEKNVVINNTQFGENKKLSDAEEALILLQLAQKLIGNEKVYNVVMSNLTTIVNQGPQEIVEAINEMLIENAKKESDIFTIFQANNCTLNKKEMWEITQKALNLQCADFISSFSPFNGWNENGTVRAIRLLVNTNNFPVGKISQLSEKMQAYAYEYMRTRSQIQVLRTGTDDQVIKLLKALNLTEEAEKELLVKDRSISELKIKYITSKKLFASSFEFLTKMKPASISVGVTYLHAYAGTWGLTPSEYAFIMQSPFYCGEAFAFESYVKS